MPDQGDTVSETTFALQPVTLAYVEKQLSQLKTNKAIGLDNISAHLLRDSAKLIAPSLRYIINLSSKTGQVPSHGNVLKSLHSLNKAIGPIKTIIIRSRFSLLLVK